MIIRFTFPTLNYFLCTQCIQSIQSLLLSPLLMIVFHLYIHLMYIYCRMNPLSNLVSHDVLLGRWRLALDLFGRVFCDDVGSEPGSVISELGGFPVKESKFRREMEKIRNSQQRDIILDVREYFICDSNLFYLNVYVCISIYKFILF